jgi:hypothetical protein
MLTVPAGLRVGWHNRAFGIVCAVSARGGIIWALWRWPTTFSERAATPFGEITARPNYVWALSLCVALHVPMIAVERIVSWFDQSRRDFCLHERSNECFSRQPGSLLDLCFELPSPIARIGNSSNDHENADKCDHLVHIPSPIFCRR